MTRIARARGEKGAELVEMALVTPILIVLMAAIFDFGMLFRTWETVTNAAREGARVGVLSGYSATDVKARVDQYMAVTGLANSCSTATYTAGVCPAPSTVGACAVCVGVGPIVTTTAVTFTPVAVSVVVNQSMPSLGGFAKLFGASASIPVGSTTTMRPESPAVAAGS
jgi:Flp pilus assembly protein TadG